MKQFNLPIPKPRLNNKCPSSSHLYIPLECTAELFDDLSCTPLTDTAERHRQCKSLQHRFALTSQMTLVT